ncbi:MAG: thioredoxin [Candidatus Omnitrophica bacterium CG12_big_fil_rev_8_21_14_0_65_43_15]|uniref:Thioredoxin n=1 Tax=Candidatus Taenaricola geysiri TaxID=1974752 RepID=A0A2J0LT64_9BACT|nr:MAG: thioredoxin [Candidatus Omnitrophica bacterium CG03_land_8_20_14_0_80_43_22]PIW67017.1 MAG: thioredoxin [Candidatus Omnitrophica bacterium CG12_big_fil_rev_8_21_14_0_65_43_15]PIW80598.1 MAG: thioredoxin [Candidatus Omnitrophica bacterium CG_4_8_14_3_um_filter_43_15]PIY84957.1 MAG: thioredoxin [Candidatus Omnitrophica bacterium CG_4_10_14_0_8_um_filter_43_18]PJC45781.1 MAG: thioredoxin [Candidatus Omnitrophica bacterium CG_4_9_14_0_2_um_filter_43_12]
MSGKIFELNDQNFEKEVMKSDIPVLVDFWAEWCGPCKALAPTLNEIALEAGNKFKIAKINVDDSPALATQSNVMNIPTMILYKGGEEVERLVGFMSKAKILDKIKNAL